MRIFISGLTGKRLLLSVFLIFLAGMVFGDPPVILTPPIFGGTFSGIENINNEANSVFRDLQDDYNNYLPANFSNLAGGFANASVFSSDGASQRGYEGYRVFSFTFGPMLAFQLPQLDLINEIMGLASSSEGEIFKKIANIPFGFDSKISAKFGMNTSFLLKDLYLGLMFSKFDTDWIKGIPLFGFSFSTMSIGVNASYQLIKQKRFLVGLLVWRGLNLGAGFIWQNTSFYFAPPLPENLTNVPIPISGVGTINMPLNGVIKLDFETNTYIVPIEAMTSIRLAGFFNLALGAGVDVAIGSSKISATGYFKVDENKVNDDLPPGLTMVKVPTMEVNLEGKSAPSFFNLKTMFAIGFNIGPVIIDIPVTYYFLSNGLSFGLTFGASL